MNIGDTVSHNTIPFVTGTVVDVLKYPTGRRIAVVTDGRILYHDDADTWDIVTSAESDLICDDEDIVDVDSN